MKALIVGITDEVTTCQCCGKPNLKRTVALEMWGDDRSTSEVRYYGADCAGRALKWSAGTVKKTGEHVQKMGRDWANAWLKVVEVA